MQVIERQTKERMGDSSEINKYTIVGFSKNIQPCLEVSSDISECLCSKFGEETLRVYFMSNDINPNDPLEKIGTETRFEDINFITSPWQSDQDGNPSLFGLTADGRGVRVDFTRNRGDNEPSTLQIVEAAPFDDPEASY